MKTIYRYEINEAINDVELPEGAKVLTVGVSNSNAIGHEIISLWAEIDTNQDYNVIRRFVIFGTGANLDLIENNNPRYIGSFKKKNNYEFHVYEVDKQ